MVDISNFIISAAKVLAFGLDKTRLNRLTHEERTYHVFYQSLSGTIPAERDHFNLEDVSDYGLLAPSGCYRLPSGPFGDDSIAMADLRVAMRTFGFKPKHMSSIFNLLVAILLLGNLQFANGDAHDVSTHVSNPHVLDQAARLLGVFRVLLNAENSGKQRDQPVCQGILLWKLQITVWRLPRKIPLQLKSFFSTNLDTRHGVRLVHRPCPSPGPNPSSQLMVKMDSTNSASIPRIWCFNLMSFAIHSKIRLGITNVWSNMLLVCLLYRLWATELVLNFCEVLSE